MANLASTYTAAVTHMYHADHLTAPYNAQIANAVDARADFGVGLATVNGAMLLVPDATTPRLPRSLPTLRGQQPCNYAQRYTARSA